MFFNGVIASSKPSVAPPERARIADALELLPSQMALSLDRTVFKHLTVFPSTVHVPQKAGRSIHQDDRPSLGLIWSHILVDACIQLITFNRWCTAVKRRT